MKKLFGTLILSLIALMVISTVDATGFKISDVEINGVDLSVDSYDNPIVNIEREDSIHLRVNVEGLWDSGDVKLKAWIGGYEYGDVEAQSSTFTVEEGITYTKTLNLEIPEDIDASKDYTLHVEAFDGNDKDEQEFTIRIKEIRHSLKVFDAVFNPGLSVNAGDNLFVKVLVENLGDSVEDKVKVEATIPRLSVSDAAYVDELVREREDDSDTVSSEVTDTLLLQIPGNAAPGNYDLLVNIVSQRGRELVTKKFTLTVGATGMVIGKENLIVNPNLVSQRVNQGSGVAYKLSLANLANEARTFAISVSAPGLTSVRSDPSTITLAGDGTGEVSVFVGTDKNTAQGDNKIIVRVLESGNTVKELTLNADVVSAGSNSVRNGLLVALIILVIILVVLGLVIAITRMKGNEAESAEEKTYY